MTRTGLARYMSRMLATRSLGALLGFAGLVQVLDLFDMVGEILDRGQGVAGILHYTALRMPVILVDVVPFAMLIGAIFTFIALAGKSEVTAMRALGVSSRRFALMLAPAALLAGALYVLASDRVAPAAESALRDWMLASADEQEPSETPREWLRSGPILIGFGGAAPDGARLERVWVYERGEGDRVVRRIVAARAIHTGTDWVLEDASVDSATGGREGARDIAMDLRLTPDDVLELSEPLEHLSLARLHAGATGGPSAARSEAFFATRLLTVWSFLVIPGIMMAIAAPVAFASVRSRRIGLQAAIALAWGLGFVLAAGVLRTLGESGVLPPVVAGWSAPAFFGLLAVARLFDLEKTRPNPRFRKSA